MRYGVLAFLCTLALLLYIDRVCIGQAADSIEKEFGLSKSQMGWISTPLRSLTVYLKCRPGTGATVMAAGA